MDQERRIFARFSTRFPTRFKDFRADYGVEVFLRDASASGIRISTRERMFLDDPVSIEVQMPDGGSPLILTGRVAWSKPASANMWDVGVNFPKINLLKMSRLMKYSLA